MPNSNGKMLFKKGEQPPSDTFIGIPDDHYAALGKVADAWADLEFEIDQLIWQLMHTNQALGACATAQMIGPAPRLKTVLALANLWELSKETQDDLRSLEGSINNLGQSRNPASHDKRLLRWEDKQVVRLGVTTKKKLVFEPVPETKQSLLDLRSKILCLIDDFNKAKINISNELLSSRDKWLGPLPQITQMSTQKRIPPDEEG